ncbi:MAG: excinuclease ABC subunit UvrB [Verrucomicrobiota bacterium]|nr:excinuclease ABC subunit UvrB [Verrucomicrobiota bacterium]MDP6252649.1 excinuclease ABC subunit UvrB [Verrucomicrobiota bacterium]MDP7176852.1 excinuclease ABC subunit UvrB [Verrucomicrobiota bacterium]MDP7293402.1 excinuclease ABC subunit UvrB [Verrucomicrobiota bacterium]
MEGQAFKLHSPFDPAGDQPEAIERLTDGLLAGEKHQTLLGVTGSGKTFTVANVIRNLNRPTLIISHNKTLAAQLYAEFKGFFPENAVEYFVSYFDYYQPEAYIPQTDTFIEKDSSINDEIERLRLSAMSSLLARRDVIVVASVSCIYGVGEKSDFEEMVIRLGVGEAFGRERLLARLVEIQYERNDIQFERGKFRVRGDTVEIRPAEMEEGIRVEFFGDEIDRISRFDPLTGNALEQVPGVIVFPGKQFITPMDNIKRAAVTIRDELGKRVAELEKQKKLLEAQRIRMRTEYDLEMMLEMGFCSGIENYSRHLNARPPGSRPSTLIDFFPKDFLLVIDESHATVPQIGGMFAGDRSRKSVLVEHGFRLPSALDNRPLNFDEFQVLQNQTLYISATPAQREIEWAKGRVVEQIVRPTGLVDPQITLKPLRGQIDDLIEEARKCVGEGERVLVTTLTKRTAEELTDYLADIGVSVRYLHSDIGAIERVEILRALRHGEFDVLVGINLLREGLDIPEVSLVAILDADKEGFLRSTTSLVQTAGRAARHLNGRVILYADEKTRSIREFLRISEYRQKKQIAHNEKHGITPRSVSRPIEQRLGDRFGGRQANAATLRESAEDLDVVETIRELEKEMIEAAEKLEFEKAALLRDQVSELKNLSGDGTENVPKPSIVSYLPKKKTKRKV